MLINSRSLFDRAIRAYFRSFPDGPQPSQYDSDLWEYAGLFYVVLRNVNGILQVYRVYRNGRLRRLRDCPFSASVE